MKRRASEIDPLDGIRGGGFFFSVKKNAKIFEVHLEGCFKFGNMTVVLINLQLLRNRRNYEVAFSG